MKKQYILVSFFIMFGFGFINFAQATIDPIPGVDIIVKPGTGGSVTANPTNLAAGTYTGTVSITSADLKVDNVGTLPTSNFYFLKQWGRGLSRFFTFNPIAKAELELNITNQIAAEALEVQKSSPNDTRALQNALQNYTNAQERLNARLTELGDSSKNLSLTVNSNLQIAELTKEVDNKTAIHSALLEQLAERWNNDPYAEGSVKKASIGDPDFDLLRKTLKDAQNNAQITFTATVTSGSGTATPTGTVSFLRQKAADEITSAEEAVKKTSTSVYGQDVTFTATLANTEGTGTPGISDQASFGALSSYARITNAKSNLDSAKSAFAEGKYGEAYGLARSAEAIVYGDGSGTANVLHRASEPGASDINETSSSSSSKQSTKISENESPLPSTRSGVTPVVAPGAATKNSNTVDSAVDLFINMGGKGTGSRDELKVEPTNTVTEQASTPEPTSDTKTIAPTLGGSGTVGSMSPIETVQAKKYEVAIVNFSFSPSTLNINKGDTVIWTNNDSAPHTVTGNDSKALSSPTLSNGQSYSFTFNESGTFNYYCSIHLMMKATVVVK